MRTSTRRGISYPLADRSDPADVPTHLANLVNALDLDTPFYSGTFAAIPAVGSVVQGSWYWATDQSTLYQNNGTSWGAVHTGSTLALTGDITARSGTATATKIGNAGPASQSGISFANAEDYLYRDAANSVTLQGATQITFKIGTTTQSGILNLMGQTAAGLRVQSYVASETNPRFTIQTDGLQAWGAGGASATDTTLSRTGIGVLTASGTFNAVTGYQVNGTPIAAANVANAADKSSGSTQVFTSRVQAPTIDIGQSAAGQIGALRIFTATTLQTALSIYKTTDTQPTLQVNNDGAFNFGPGGATVPDTSILRGTGGVLAVNNKVVELFTNTGVTVPGTWTPDVAAGPVQRVGVTAGGASTLTIGAVANQASALGTIRSMFLALRIVNTGGGTITLSWNAIYHASGVTALPASVANGAAINCLFFWNPSDNGWQLLAAT